MAGLPLKSGADFYNLEAARLRLHNLGADPTEVGAGLIYFNTSTGLNTSQKARLYTGSAWKTIAFSEDLDVASNADFLALKDRVDLLSGDVDTDAIISNMKEVSAFLEGFAEDDSLMDYLNTELGKKLDLTGGTIKGVVVLNGNGATNVPLNIATPSMGNTGYIRFGAGISANELGHLGFSAKGEPAMVYEGTVHPLLHSGNYSDYALPKAGGTIKGAGNTPLLINTESDSQVLMWLQSKDINKLGLGWNGTSVFMYNYTSKKYLGIKDDGTPYYDSYTLLHSGNVGEYTCKAININSDITDTDKAYVGRALSAWTNWGKATNNPNGVAYTSGLTISFAGNAFQIAKDAYDLGKLYVRMSNYQSDSIPSWSDWKTIAFTDSTVDKAKALVDGYGLSVVSVANSILDLNRNASSGEFYNSANMGLEVECKATEIIFKGYKTDGQLGGRIFLNSSGNVTIGGTITIEKKDTLLSLYSLSEAGVMLQSDGSGGDVAAIYLHKGSGNGFTFAEDNRDFVWRTGSDAHNGGGAGTERMRLTNGGNVLIGTTDDNGAKLNVHGGLFVNKYLESGNKSGAYVVINKGTDYFGIGGSASGVAKMSFGTTSDTIGTWKKEIMTFLDNGNVGIGTTNPQAKLEVVYSTGTSGIEITRVSSSDEASIAFNGQDGLRSVVGTWNNALNLWHNGAVGLSISKNLDVHIAGNLIVDGEVSAGGAAEEGSTSGSGAGAFHSESIGVGATQTTIAHGLGTDDIVVSIYEKDGVSGRWSIILTDVEIVDANNIIVSFGSATTVEHKVVIMGAVA